MTQHLIKYMDNFTFFSTHELKVPSAYNKPDLTNKHLMDEIVVVAERDRNSFFSAADKVRQ